ncbi:RNA-guided endonuclease TnpB family protein [Bacillus carboniphilus]|uniref:RNA-guided endonuclease TnpB family protein n=1 Tax=Bacillus carboniphilus TaxID=86663 RepID=A0ABY9JZZ5_9BACI|nr:RNA-guided endonuclease TnpB family protein [Bacillus carboniphilus]WLR43216.1 RNA-guided endonuclease TnpB family protein [Bacillus carboniphilus]
MTKLNKAYKFRIYPTREQASLIRRTFGCVRFVYNKMLDDRKKTYEKYKDDKETLKMQKFPTPAQYKKEFEWLKEVDSLALANAQINLQKAYQNFFAKKADFPTFKSRKSRQSYSTNVVNGNIELIDGLIKLSKLKWIKIKQHRPIPDGHKIKACTISMTKTGKFFVSILTEYEKKIVEQPARSLIGLDFAMNGLFVDSETGKKANYPRFYRQMVEKLAKESRILARRTKGSSRWHQQRLKVAKIHEKIANQRKDFLHKQSYRLANQYDCVIIEDLDMKGMSQALKFGKSVADNAWGRFTSYLEYKLKEQGKKLIKIDKWFPSSKTCSNCGQIKEELTLSDRVFDCHCGFSSDRDWNASINIKNEGIRKLT